MITFSARFRYYLGFSLLALLGVLLAVSAQAQEPSAPARARAYTRHLTQALHLLPHQYEPVYRATLARVQAQDSLQLFSSPVADVAQRAEQRYQQALHPQLTAGQFNAFMLLRSTQPTEAQPAALTARQR